jgi:hypothetical protein
VHVSFFARWPINFPRDAFLRMISKRLAIDYAKSKSSAYVGAAVFSIESLEEENVEKPHPSQQT